MNIKLIHIPTGKEIRVGDIVTTFRGEKVTLEHFDERRVYCCKIGGKLQFQWFPFVIACKIVIEDK